MYGTHGQSVQSTVGFIPSQPVSAFGESAPGRAIHERVHVLGTVCGDAVLPLVQTHSLREICDGLSCCLGKLIHVGVREAPKRSTLSYANKHRPWQLYERVFYQLLEKCRLDLSGALAASRQKFRFRNKLLSLDASVIDLCVSLFDWAKFRMAGQTRLSPSPQTHHLSRQRIRQNTHVSDQPSPLRTHHHCAHL